MSSQVFSGTKAQASRASKPASDANVARSNNAHDVWTWLFALALFFGLACRFVGLNWDEGTLLHPDERFYLSMVERLNWPSSWAEHLNSARSPFNPANLDAMFVYGQLPLVFGKAWLAAWTGAPIVGLRFLSALFDASTVVLTVLIARRTFSTRAALLAGTAVSLAALHVQASHFFTSDTFAVTFGVAAFGFATRFSDTHRVRDAILTSVLLGLALACKVSALFFGVPLLVLAVAALVRAPKTARGNVFLAMLALLGAPVITILAFRVGHPMAFRGEGGAFLGVFDLRLAPKFWNDLAYQAAITRGELDVPFNVQWIDRADFWFPLQNLAFWGWGWAVLIGGALGIGVFVVALARRKIEAPQAVLLGAALLFLIVSFGVQSTQFSKFTRYFLPLTPFVGLFCAFLYERGAARFPKVANIVAVLSVTGTVFWCAAVTSIWTRPHPRLEASRWIAQNIPPGTVVAHETSWDEGLPISWGPTGNAGLRFVNLESYDVETVKKRERLEKLLNEAEWIFQSSGRSWQNIPRWREKYPLMSEFYFALQDGRLGFERAQEFTSYPQLGPFEFPDDDLEEALSVYDHPRVILWKKRADYSPEQTKRVLRAVQLPRQQAWQPRFAHE